MEYSPRREREIRDSMLMPPGIYDFEVVSANEKQSKAGNDMIELQLRIFPVEGSPRLLKDWLVAGSDLGELKINRFAHSVGLQEIYFAGQLNAFACDGQAGKLKLTVTSSEQWGDQNAVKDYVVPKPDEVADEPPKPETTELKQPVPTGDDIPF